MINKLLFLIIFLIPTFNLGGLVGLPRLSIVPALSIFYFIFLIIKNSYFVFNKLISSYTHFLFTGIIFLFCSFLQNFYETEFNSFNNFVFGFYILSMPFIINILRSDSLRISILKKIPGDNIIQNIFSITLILGIIQLILFKLIGLKLIFIFKDSVDFQAIAQSTPFSLIPGFDYLNTILRNSGSSVMSIFGERVHLAIFVLIFLLIKLYLKNINSSFFKNKGILILSIIMLSLSGSSISILLIPLFTVSIIKKNLEKIKQLKFKVIKIKRINNKLFFIFMVILSSILIYSFVGIIIPFLANIISLFDSGNRLSGLLEMADNIGSKFYNVDIQNLLFGVGVIPTSSMTAFEPEVGIVGHGLTGWNYIVNGFGIIGLTSFATLTFIQIGKGFKNIFIKSFITFLFLLAVGSPMTYIYLYVFALIPDYEN